MNCKKIAFIMCINNLTEYSEAKRYIDNLIIPEDFETDVLAVQEAPSMCVGYNAAVQSTDAKYKVFMHQDVYIINKNFIADLLRIFENPSIGLVGMLGKRKMPSNAFVVSSWDTGKVNYNDVGYVVNGYQDESELYTEVEAVDGLLIATQYDLPFREDIFKKFDFYDISTCLEYRKAGYKVVTANQIDAWVYHNEKNCNMTHFEKERQVFMDTYGGKFGIDKAYEVVYNLENEKAVRQQLKVYEDMIDFGKIEEVVAELAGGVDLSNGFRDIKLLTLIYQYEKQSKIFNWNVGIKGLYEKLDDLKRFLKRVEFGVEMDDSEYMYYCTNYALLSIITVVYTYCLKKRDVMNRLTDFLPNGEVIERILHNMPNEVSRIDYIKSSGNFEAYNFDESRVKKDCLVVVGNMSDINSVQGIVETLEKEGILNAAIFFAEKEGVAKALLEEKRVPFVIGNSMAIKMYAMELNWNINKAIYVGDGNLVNELKRLFYGSKTVAEEYCERGKEAKVILDEENIVKLYEMNSNKIAFIMCVNNLEEYSEAKRYIDNLIVPDGFETDVIAVQEASSMCEGYNGGMQATDAKYKVYMHQDVRIINKNFIADLLKVFEDDTVGLIGMVGTRKMPRDGYAVMAWDTGKVYYNGDDFSVMGYEYPGALYTEVEAIDGLLFATQYDVPFREDLFADWDYYDISIAYEHRRAGYKVVVPHQTEPWTYHNDSYSKMTKYDDNRVKFLKEYSCDFDLDSELGIRYDTKREELIRHYIKSYEIDVNSKGMAAVADEILNSKISSLGMKDLMLLARICKSESGRSVFDWNGGIDNLYMLLNELKRFLKRVEYDVPMDEEEYKLFCTNYSLHSVVMTVSVYCMKMKKVFEILSKYIPEKDVILRVISDVSDTFSWRNNIEGYGGVTAYNLHNWTNDTKVPIVIQSLGDENGTEKIIDFAEKNSAIDKVIVFAAEEGNGLSALVEVGISVIIGPPICVKMYSMDMNWDIDKAFVVGDGFLIDEFKRIYSGSHIGVGEIL